MALDHDLWGPEPSDDELAAARAVARCAAAEAQASLPAGWDRGADGQPLPHLDDAHRAYPGSDLSFAVWMTTPSADLGGVTPAQALVDGRRRAVIEAAAALTFAGG